MADAEPGAVDLTQAGQVRSIEGADAASFHGEVESRYEPAVLRQLTGDWPAVRAARESTEALVRYLSGQDNGTPIRAFVGQPDISGRYFYRPDMDGFNFDVAETKFSSLLAALLDPAQANRSIYMGSTPTRGILPQFASENPMRIAADRGGEPRIWVGNSSRVAPHYDESDNIACVVSGRRRFILFPPEQLVNLYVGPIDRTIAGQPISMVDLDRVDFERFPRFREALKHALVADLEPGDAIYIPALWWHAVQANGPLNILVNYWWSDAPPDAGSPMHALGHGLLTISHLPEEKRQAWRNLFDHYVFKTNGDPAAHIPVAARGIVGRSTPELRKTLRQFLIRALQSL
ncbi:cupin-like protein [Sphingomonas sp. F9_3S_D5_B_2]